jgi:plastocyanin
MKLTSKGALILASAALLVPSAVLAATTVKGKVVNTSELMNPVWNEAKNPDAHRFTFREPASSVPAELRKLRGLLSKELCLVALSEGNASPKPRPLKVVIEGGRTNYVTIVVAAGQEIRFENHDPTDHKIYEVSGKGQFDAGNMKPEGTRTWTPPGPGKYEIRDELAPSLRSWVVVEPRAVEAFFPNRKGDFVINLEPANYKLRAYYNGEPVGEELPLEIKGPAPELVLKDPLKAGADKATPAPDGEKKDDKTAPGAKVDPAKGGG